MHFPLSQYTIDEAIQFAARCALKAQYISDATAQSVLAGDGWVGALWVTRENSNHAEPITLWPVSGIIDPTPKINYLVMLYILEHSAAKPDWRAVMTSGGWRWDGNIWAHPDGRRQIYSVERTAYEAGLLRDFEPEDQIPRAAERLLAELNRDPRLNPAP